MDKFFVNLCKILLTTWLNAHYRAQINIKTANTNKSITLIGSKKVSYAALFKYLLFFHKLFVASVWRFSMPVSLPTFLPCKTSKSENHRTCFIIRPAQAIIHIIKQRKANNVYLHNNKSLKKKLIWKTEHCVVNYVKGEGYLCVCAYVRAYCVCETVPMCPQSKRCVLYLCVEFK